MLFAGYTPGQSDYRELMEHVTPLGSMVHFGTYNANPLAMAAGLETLRAHRDVGRAEAKRRACASSISAWRAPPMTTLV